MERLQGCVAGSTCCPLDLLCHCRCFNLPEQVASEARGNLEVKPCMSSDEEAYHMVRAAEAFDASPLCMDYEGLTSLKWRKVSHSLLNSQKLRTR